MKTSELFNILANIDQLEAHEIADLEYMEQRIEIHIDNAGEDVNNYDIPALARELQSVMLN